MINKIIEKLNQYTNIAILGFGREGKTTYEFIRKHNKDIKLTIIDKSEQVKDNNPEVANDPNTTFVMGPTYLEGLDQYDLIIKSPGISLLGIDTTNLRDKITSQLELVLEVNKKNMIGITGTKGKSTTSSLLYKIIKDQNENVILAGNIGIPLLSEIENCDENTILVIEMSSHQLEYLNTSPHIAVILNLFEDHLDHSGTIEHYHENKLQIFKNQETDDYMIYCCDDKTLANYVANNAYKGIPCTISRKTTKATCFQEDDYINLENEQVYNTKSERKLLGTHNITNIMVCLTIAKILKLDLVKATESVSTFEPLEYRLQNIGTVDGVTYYTDTLATIPEATIEAINSITNIDSLIFGGMDRGINYDKLIEFLKTAPVRNLICMPTTGHDIGHALGEIEDKNIYYVETLEEAVDLAKEITKKGTNCVLSPAAASYTQFKNYADKGDKFKAFVYSKKQSN